MLLDQHSPLGPLLDRCSKPSKLCSIGHRLAVQVDKLKHCDKLFQGHTSGVIAKRPCLAECLEYGWEEDTLVVTRLDRLTRSTQHLCQLTETLARKRVHLPLSSTLIPAMPRAVCYSTCWGRWRSLRRSSASKRAIRGDSESARAGDTLQVAQVMNPCADARPLTPTSPRGRDQHPDARLWALQGQCISSSLGPSSPPGVIPYSTFSRDWAKPTGCQEACRAMTVRVC